MVMHVRKVTHAPGVNGIDTVLPRTNSLVFCLAWGRLSKDAEFVACQQQLQLMSTVPGATRDGYSD